MNRRGGILFKGLNWMRGTTSSTTCGRLLRRSISEILRVNRRKRISVLFIFRGNVLAYFLFFAEFELFFGYKLRTFTRLPRTMTSRLSKHHPRTRPPAPDGASNKKSVKVDGVIDIKHSSCDVNDFFLLHLSLSPF